MPNKEIDIPTLLTDPDWAQVFADESYGNVDKTVRVAPPDSKVSFAPMCRADVVEIIAVVNGENDEQEWIGVFRLADGRFLVAQGSCDYTGWDCQAGNALTVCASMEDVLAYGLTDIEKGRLGLL